MDSKPKAWTLWRILLSLLPAFILLPLWWVQGAQDPSSSETLKSDYQLNSLTEKERTWLRDHPVIRVVQDPAWPPVEFIDKHGKSSGMTRDYLDLIEKKIGITFQQVRNLSWQESYARLKQWEIDMTTSVTETPERNEFWAFTKPYMKIPMVIAAHINVTYIADMSELAGKKVAVVDGYAIADWLPRDFPDIPLIKVKTVQEGLSLLEKEKVFALIDNMLVIGYYLAQLKITNLKIAGETPYMNAQCMAVRKDWAILAGILQKALDSISEAERDNIYRKWLPILYEHGFNYTLFWQTVALFSLVVLVLAAWIWKLLKEIKHRKKAEIALIESEKKLREAQKLANLGYWRWDIKTGNVVWSEEVYRIFRLDPETFTPRIDSILALSPWPEDHHRDKELIRKATENHETGFYEQRFLHPDGSIGYYYSTFQGDYDNKGNLISIVGTVQDITERKQTEELLRKSESKYRLLADNAADVIFIFDFYMNITYISPSVKKLRGFDPEEIIGHPFSESITVESAQYVKRIIQEELENEKAGTSDPNRTRIMEVEMLCKDGSTIWTEVKASFLRDEDNRPTGIMGITRDVSERKKMEKTIRENEEQFRKIFEESPYGMAMCGSDFRFIRVNGAFCRMVGYTEQELTKLTFRDITHTDNIETDVFHVTELIKGKISVYRTEKRYIRKNKEVVWGSVTVTVMYDRDGQFMYLLSTIEDITEQKRIEEEKMRLESKLFQAQKMEAIGTLTGGIAHDFNNILTALMGYAALLKMSLTTGALSTYVEQILSASQKGADLIRNLLIFSRQQAVSLTPVGINKTIKTTEKLLKRLLTEDISFETLLSKEELTIMADATQIDQILFNLATNARDAMPSGGIFNIETRPVELDEDFNRTHGYGKPGKYALLSVSDTGCGMEKTIVEKAFDPFFTTKEMGKGTGLGLSTVYGIVKQHNGYITVYSEPAVGTTFRIYFPIADDASIMKKQAPSSIRGGRETILVTEDNEAVRNLIRDILRQYGYTVIEATDGQDAVDKFKKNHRIDLLLLDSVMPKINGREVYRQISETKPDIKVLFMSGYTRDVILDKGIEDELYDFISKPIAPNTLLLKVREVLDRQELP